MSAMSHKDKLHALARREVSQGVSFASRFYGSVSDISISTQTSVNAGRLERAIGGLTEFNDYAGTGTGSGLHNPSFLLVQRMDTSFLLASSYTELNTPRKSPHRDLAASRACTKWGKRERKIRQDDVSKASLAGPLSAGSYRGMASG
jgi:hypothetical protein